MGNACTDPQEQTWRVPNLAVYCDYVFERERGRERERWGERDGMSFRKGLWCCMGKIQYWEEINIRKAIESSLQKQKKLSKLSVLN